MHLPTSTWPLPTTPTSLFCSPSHLGIPTPLSPALCPPSSWLTLCTAGIFHIQSDLLGLGFGNFIGFRCPTGTISGDLDG